MPTMVCTLVPALELSAMAGSAVAAVEGAVASPTILVRGRRPSKDFLFVIVDLHIATCTCVVYTLRLDDADTVVQSAIILM